MDSIWSKLREKKKWYPYLLILLLACLAEILIGNFSFWKMKNVEPVVLLEDGTTDENGVLESSEIVVNRDIKNICVDLELTNTQTADVTLAITDEGDRYLYELPSFTVVPEVRDTHYANIYPYGTVQTMKVKITVPEGTKAQIRAITLNAAKPFSFRWLRATVFFLFLIFLYIMREKSPVHSISCKRGNRVQILITAMAVLTVVAAAFLFVRMNPLFQNAPWPHQHQYEELAVSMAQGEVALSYEPSKELLSTENPYDTRALQIDGTEYQMDYAFFNGKYYVYFGIVPELLFFLPYHLLTGKNLPNYATVFALYSLLGSGVFVLIREIIFYLKKTIAFAHYLLISFTVCFFANYVFMAARPEIYHIPILAGTAFTIWGLFFWTHGLSCDKGKKVSFFLGPFCMALVAGCRPQMLLYSVVAIFLFYRAIIKERSLFSKKSWKETLSLCIPYVAVAALVFWYNEARFGSGFDFGATYSLTSNDMNNRGFNIARILHGLFCFFFQPAVINSTFPFLYSNEMQGTFLSNAYIGKEMTEFMYGGVFAVCPFLWMVFYGIFGGCRKLEKKEKGLFFFLTVASLLIAAFDVNGAGIIYRYVADMALGFLLASVLMWTALLDRNREEKTFAVCTKFLCFAFMTGIAYTFMTVFASGDVSTLQYTAPQIFYEVSSYFRF